MDLAKITCKIINRKEKIVVTYGKEAISIYMNAYQFFYYNIRFGRFLTIPSVEQLKPFFEKLINKKVISLSYSRRKGKFYVSIKRNFGYKTCQTLEEFMNETN